MSTRLRAVLIGMGKMGAGYASDPVTARHFKYATHAQVLQDHPAFDWRAVVDPAPTALASAMKDWHVPVAVESVAQLPHPDEYDVAILATPPSARTGIIKMLPSLSTVLIEKPIGTSLVEGNLFLNECDKRGIKVQVNMWRRGDELMQELAAGKLREYIGVVQAVTGLYGNGLINNGVHLIDLLRMFFGEPRGVSVHESDYFKNDGPIPGDIGAAYSLIYEHFTAGCHALDFRHFREIGVDIWGSTGRLQILQEGVYISRCRLKPHRSLTDALEVASDEPTPLRSTVGTALYRMYDNIAEHAGSETPFWCPGSSAMKSEEIAHDIRNRTIAVCRPRTAPKT